MLLSGKGQWLRSLGQSIVACNDASRLLQIGQFRLRQRSLISMLYDPETYERKSIIDIMNMHMMKEEISSSVIEDQRCSAFMVQCQFNAFAVL